MCNIVIYIEFSSKHDMRMESVLERRSGHAKKNYANVFDMSFIGRVLQNFTFQENFARFSSVNALPRDVEEIMQITCPAFQVHPMSSKFALTDSYMYQNKQTGVKFEKFHDGTPP